MPATHSIRTIKTQVDTVLRRMSPVFDRMSAEAGRPSLPPERLLKAKGLIALFSVRLENLFVEQLDYKLLYRCFLDLDLAEPVFDNSTFSKNQTRLMEHDAAKIFFAQMADLAREQRWVSDEHFSVDGTLIEAWASLKSFVPKQGAPALTDDDPGNLGVDFRGEQRSNATHQSTTDPEARLKKKAAGQEAKLCYALHALMENWSGLSVDLQVSSAVGVTEGDDALAMLKPQARTRTVGADNGYHHGPFVHGCRELDIAPHVARAKGRRIAGLDGRTARTAGYALRQKIRKRIEEGFGWRKTVGAFRKTRFKGSGRTQLSAYLVGAACDLVRMAKFGASPHTAKCALLRARWGRCLQARRRTGKTGSNESKPRKKIAARLRCRLAASAKNTKLPSGCQIRRLFQKPASRTPWAIL